MWARKSLIIGIVRNVGVLGKADGKMKRGKAMGKWAGGIRERGKKKMEGYFLKQELLNKKNIYYI